MLTGRFLPPGFMVEMLVPQTTAVLIANGSRTAI